jgi:hypothetical protein
MNHSSGQAQPANTPPTAMVLRRLSKESLGVRRPLAGRINPRRMTARQMAEWAAELHADGMMNWAEYAMAGFPAELHPDYNDTVGALTGERADPDQPRDMIALWEDRYQREKRCLGPMAAQVSGRIVELLRWQAASLNIAA